MSAGRGPTLGPAHRAPDLRAQPDGPGQRRLCAEVGDSDAASDSDLLLRTQMNNKET